MRRLKSFDMYRARIYGGSQSDGRVAILYCYMGGSQIGYINFYRNDAAIPDDQLFYPDSEKEEIVLHMPMDRFEPVMSMMRQEGPLCLVFYAQNIGSHPTSGEGYLETGNTEPVGEEEGKT